jgi:AraC-like DNA-binding protein
MDNKLQLLRYHYSQPRDQFMLPEDQYEGWVILAAQSGGFSFSIEGTKHAGEARYGQLVFCPPGLILQREALEPISFHFIEFLVHSTFMPEGLVTLKDLHRLTSTFQFLQSVHKEAPADYQESIEHLVGDLLFQTYRESIQASSLHRVSSDPLMEQALAYIEQFACDKYLSMSVLSDKLHLSSSQLTRRFQKTFQLSPIEYATGLRLQKARALLCESRLSLDEIAERCGAEVSRGWSC